MEVSGSQETDTQDEPMLLTVLAAAHLLGCGRSYVYSLVARGELPLLHFGRAARIPRAALEDLVARKSEYARWRQEQLRAKRVRTRRRRLVIDPAAPPRGAYEPDPTHARL